VGGDHPALHERKEIDAAYRQWKQQRVQTCLLWMRAPFLASLARVDLSVSLQVRPCLSICYKQWYFEEG
jgi:hypothetical protein